MQPIRREAHNKPFKFKSVRAWWRRRDWRSWGADSLILAVLVFIWLCSGGPH